MRLSEKKGVSRPRSAFAAIVCLLLAVAGCGQGAGQVTGQLTIDGQPAPAGLILEFQPQIKESSASYGRTDATGRFEVWKTGSTKGVSPGTSLVRISIPPPDTSGRGPPKLPAELEKLTIPARYGSASELQFDIKPGHQNIDIAITLKP